MQRPALQQHLQTVVQAEKILVCSVLAFYRLLSFFLVVLSRRALLALMLLRRESDKDVGRESNEFEDGKFSALLMKQTGIITLERLINGFFLMDGF